MSSNHIEHNSKQGKLAANKVVTDDIIMQISTG